ncbi:centromere protein W isoform X1 [Gallus gallus]|uniref:Centromere protein W n=1 Tax=Gallus gallus TaxID=9031 RepID=A0A8V0XUX4_CHICK|nr:centromere protein W isoform X1 [Gallus gallus]XP_046769954.1 centromere protein W isoform X1 [Gallus gallus]|eukprot:XP_015139919.1 centromere protein W isoform X1 [Gallus gallus]
MRRTVPRGTLRKIIKKHKPHLRLAANTDLLVHLSFLLFLHRLAEEARTNAFENKSKIIKPEHTIAAAKLTSLEEICLLWNYRMAFFGRDLKDHPVPTPCHG